MKLNDRLSSAAIASAMVIASIAIGSFAMDAEDTAPAAIAATPGSWVATAFPIGQASFAQPAAPR